MLRATSLTSIRCRAVAAGGLTALASLMLAPVAAATLVYATGGVPTAPPKLPQPEWVWAAHNDGTAAHRLARGGAPHVSPDGRLVAYASSRGLEVIAASGGQPRMLIASGWQDEPTLAWSPDSKTLVAVTGSSELSTKHLVWIDVASGTTLRTLAGGYDFFGADFSPDGSRVIYTRAPGVQMNTDLFIVTVATGRVRQFTRDRHSSSALWGRGWIVFARSRKPARSNDAPKQDLYLAKPSRSDVHRLTFTKPGFLLAGLAPVAWSGGGKRLLAEFVGQDTSYAEIVNPSTGQVRRVGTSAQGLVGYALSRDGRWILATTGGPEPVGSSVVMVPYGGSKLRVLARNAHSPDWSL
jgi:Tol biopolymer transport system component